MGAHKLAPVHYHTGICILALHSAGHCIAHCLLSHLEAYYPSRAARARGGLGPAGEPEAGPEPEVQAEDSDLRLRFTVPFRVSGSPIQGRSQSLAEGARQGLL